MNGSLLVGLILTVGAPAKDAPKKETSIVGEWAGEKFVQGGKERPTPEGGVHLTFTADGKFLVREGKREQAEQGTYKTDAKKDPAEIDILPPAEKAERGSLRAIYKLDGDTLTLCFTTGKEDAERPTKFESPEGSRIRLMTLKRVKKD
jgi:uncharacterized protein (TIGR03067 family)